MRVLSIDVGIKNLGVSILSTKETTIRIEFNKIFSPLDYSTKLLKKLVRAPNTVNLYEYFNRILEDNKILRTEFDTILIEKQPALNKKNVRFEAVIYTILSERKKYIPNANYNIRLMNPKDKLSFLSDEIVKEYYPKKNSVKDLTYKTRKSISRRFASNLFQITVGEDDGDAIMQTLAFFIEKKEINLSDL